MNISVKSQLAVKERENNFIEGNWLNAFHFKYPLFFIVLILFICITSCTQDVYMPKPTGYLRIDFPEKVYIPSNKPLPYVFEFPQYGSLVRDTDAKAEPYWINIEFPKYKGKIHLSYKQIVGNVDKYIEDAHKMAYKHAIKADAIDETVIRNDSASVYGILYDIHGNTASSVQFYVTDEKRHFLRGALYFNSSPNKDSLAPAIAFFREDIVHFIGSLRWVK